MTTILATLLVLAVIAITKMYLNRDQPFLTGFARGIEAGYSEGYDAAFLDAWTIGDDLNIPFNDNLEEW